MLAILAPGQGAQTPGFLAPWLELPAVRARLLWWSAVTGVDLIAAGTEWDAERIRDTAIAQPLLVAAGLAAVEQVLPAAEDRAAVGVLAGHSVGELTASAISGALTPEAALVLVRERGNAMAKAAAAAETGMTAVLGGDPDEVLATIAEHGLTAANHNGKGQIVAAGSVAALAAFAAAPPAGARLRPLSVAGAFHTAYMAPATDRLAELAPGAGARDLAVRMISNADGAIVTSGRQLLERLVAQVAAPVRWDECMNTLAALGVTAVIELPPAGTLVGMVRRAIPGVETLSLNTPDQLDEAKALLSAHGQLAPEPVPAWRLVVAPVAGTFRPGPSGTGTEIAPGHALGVVESRGRAEDVVAAHGGTLVEWLAEEGDPVLPGQALARLHPAELTA